MSARFKLTFPQELIREPIIFNMAKKYDLMPNIRRARITSAAGEMILELEGDEENIKKGIDSIKQQGVNVELVEGDILE